MPRDPARIDPMLAEIAEYWHRFPDLRLTQLVLNLTRMTENKYFRLPYFIEDDVIMDVLQKMKEEDDES